MAPGIAAREAPPGRPVRPAPVRPRQGAGQSAMLPAMRRQRANPIPGPGGHGRPMRRRRGGALKAAQPGRCGAVRTSAAACGCAGAGRAGPKKNGPEGPSGCAAAWGQSRISSLRFRLSAASVTRAPDSRYRLT